MRSFLLSIALLLLPLTAWAAEFEDAVAAYQRQDFTAAYPVFMGLARDGHSGAETMLGVMYFNGQGIEKNESFAAIWFYKASRKGNANAQLAFGSLHIRGVGVLQNLTKAYKWLTLAAERGENEVASEAQRLRGEISTLMTAEEREKASEEARAWRPVITNDDPT